MDTLSHGLWGGAAFGQASRSNWRWAFFLGMAPDLFSFGPFFLTHLGDIGERWAHHRFGPPDPTMIPSYVYHAYNVTHSLLIWIILLGLAFLIFGRRGIVMSAWGLHILCDIPTHSTRFFPTPYLWPFQTPYYNGTPWATLPFMLGNYALIVFAYLAIARIRGRSAGMKWPNDRRRSFENLGFK